MRKSIFFVILALFTPALRGFEVFYTSNRQGEIEPCGCKVNQVGGLDRLYSYLKEKRTRPDSLLVDAGDTFFIASELNPMNRLVDEKKAKLIAKVYAQMKVDFFTPGERDFAAGLDFLKELAEISKTKFVSANLVNQKGEPLFSAFEILEVGKERVGITGVASADAFSPVAGVQVRPVEEALDKVTKEFEKAKVTRRVLLSHLGLAQDRTLAKYRFDLIVGSHSMDALDVPEKVENSYLVQPMLQGQQIGSLVWKTGSDKAEHQLIGLGKEWQKKSPVAKALARYRQEVRGLALADTKAVHVAVPESKQPFVAHPAYCKNCHPKEYAFWAKTKHSSAYLVLFSKNQHFDPLCIGCHSLGFQAPQGFQKIAKPILLNDDKGEKPRIPFVEQIMNRVFGEELKKGPLDSRLQPDRHKKLHARYFSEIDKLEEEGRIKKIHIGVQCEHCHGNRDGHPPPNAVAKFEVSLKTCNTCHAAPNGTPVGESEWKRISCKLNKEKN